MFQLKQKVSIAICLLLSIVNYSQSKHVVLISIDGFRPDFYLEDEWPAPVIKEMATQGTKALGVRGVFPSVTYPSHTTLVTGEKPYKHGIYYNTPFEREENTGKWFWDTSLIQTKTLWRAVREANQKSASFFWPVSVNAPIDYNIPEVWDVARKGPFLGKNREHESPKGFLKELETTTTGILTKENFNGDDLNKVDRTGEMAAYTMETYKPNFMTVHFIATDHFQHSEGKKGPTVYKALAATDRAIGKIVEAAKRAGIIENTTFIITGDHGFVDVHSALSPNVWLKELGLLQDTRNRGEDWKAAFHTSGASAFLILKDSNDTKTLKKVQQKLASLPENIKKLFRVVSKEELIRVGSSKEAALAIAPVPGIAMSSSSEGEILKSATGGTHGFFPNFKAIETGFIGWGSDIQTKKTLEHMNLEDIAPIVAKILGLDFMSEAGVLYPGVLKN